MSLFSQIRDALLPRSSEGCASCLHFCTEAGRIEAHLPGLSSLSSAHASVRGEDGLCLSHNRIINGRRRCGTYEPASKA